MHDENDSEVNGAGKTSDSSLCSKIKQNKIFWMKKKQKQQNDLMLIFIMLKF